MRVSETSAIYILYDNIATWKMANDFIKKDLIVRFLKY